MNGKDMFNDFSEIQSQILSKLLKAKGLRYSEARPENRRLENDLFNYHLQFLVKKGFVEKVNNLYCLTDRGKTAIQFYDSQGVLKDRFRVSVLCYLIDKNKKKILLQKRIRHPYIDDIGVISGKINLGEKIETAAARKLKEETGLKAGLKFIGVFRTIRKKTSGEIVEDTLYHICYSDRFKGKLLAKSDFGENFWDTFTKAIFYQRKNKTASKNLEEILKRLKNHNFEPFYFEETIKLKDL